jgi:hypothetical protein
MGVAAATTNFVGLTVTLFETQRKAAINAPTIKTVPHVSLKTCSRRNVNAFAMLGINANSYKVVVWVKFQVSGPMNIWWLNRK